MLPSVIGSIGSLMHLGAIGHYRPPCCRQGRPRGGVLKDEAQRGGELRRLPELLRKPDRKRGGWCHLWHERAPRRSGRGPPKFTLAITCAPGMAVIVGYAITWAFYLSTVPAF
jgi:hypothetical protein